MENKAWVSIITVCYNSEKTIRYTIESVVNQSYKNIEYIIVDGKSKDNTLEIIKEYEKTALKKGMIYKYISEPDKGIYDAMNKGIKIATGEIIGILNSDDFYVDNNVILDIVNKFIESKSKIVYGQILMVSETDTSKVVREWRTSQCSFISFKRGFQIPHPAMFVKKEIYEAYGLYSTELRISADYEFALRVIKKQEKDFCYIPRFITYMRIGGESTKNIRSIIKGNSEIRKSWEMNNLQIPFYTIPFKLISKMMQKIVKKNKE